MNQILASKKVYVTPDMKVKKKLFKINFILSVCFLCAFSFYYIYDEVDRIKSEEVSKEILQGITFEEMHKKLETQKNLDQEAIRVVLNNALIEVPEEEMNETQELDVPQEQKTTAKDGTQYFAIGVINISKIGINYPILSTTSEELLKISPCKFWGPNPNEIGNLCIVGHNYRNSKFFSKIANLETGDIIDITDLSGRTIKYSVYNKYEVQPDDVSCTSQLTNGNKEITLITCTNDNKLRTVVKATEVK